MLAYLTIIFCCQLVGELSVSALGLPLPGPVVGMVLLFVGLLIRGSVPPELNHIADFLLKNLSLLFIPAGVGILLHVKLIGEDWLPITITLVISTVLTVAVTAYSMICLNKLTLKHRSNNDE